MVHLTLAVGDFMLLLLTSAGWVAAGIAACAAAGLGAAGGLISIARRWRRR